MNMYIDIHRPGGCFVFHRGKCTRTQDIAGVLG